jgi:hypothetical protein
VARANVMKELDKRLAVDTQLRVAVNLLKMTK